MPYNLIRILCGLLLAGGCCWAQPIQLTWEGEVDAEVTLTIEGQRVVAQAADGAPVARERSRFQGGLPALDQSIRVELQQGRGLVRIVQQPSSRNGFVARVVVEDPAAGRAFYRLVFLWQPGPENSAVHGVPVTGGPGAAPPAGNPPAPAASGPGERRYRIVEGNSPPIGRSEGWSNQSPAPGNPPAPGERPWATGAPPAQPGNANGGERPWATNPGPTPAPSEQPWSSRPANPPTLRRDGPAAAFALRWLGRVDGVVRVVVTADRTRVEVLNGKAVAEEQALFERPLPQQSGLRPTLRKVRGRGPVELVENPTPANGYRLTFEIRDTQGGSEFYEVELSW